MLLQRLAKIGFFHFGSDDQSNPIGSLQASLREALKSHTLDDCLVVLPEAFNIQNGYWMPGRRIELSIAQSLKKISAELKVAFVAGLIEESGGHWYSSAGLIDGGVCKRLSRKTRDDGSQNYAISGNCDTPYFHRGMSVAALICMDAAGFNPSCGGEQHKALLARLDSFGPFPKVLCVPAHFMEYDTKGVALAWSAHVPVVIANSHPHQPSVIRIGAQVVCVDGVQNAVRFTKVPPADCHVSS